MRNESYSLAFGSSLLAACAVLLSALSAHAQQQPGAKESVPTTDAAPQPQATDPTGDPEGTEESLVQSRDGRWTLNLGGRIQARFTGTSVGKARETDDTPEDQELAAGYSAAFSVPRAIVILSGQGYTEDLTYKLQANLGGAQLKLEDAYINYQFAEQFAVRVGRDKRPFSRQFISSDAELQLVDRASSEEHYGTARDVGILLHNNYTQVRGFEYAAGVYQGAFQQSQLSAYYNPDTEEYEIAKLHYGFEVKDIEPTVVVRLGYNNGILGYRESDLEGGDFRYGIGWSTLADLNTNRSGEARAQTEVDAILKVHGFSLSTALFVELRQTGEDFMERDAGAAAFYLQSGYVIGGVVEPTLRLATSARSDDYREEIENENGDLVHVAPFAEATATWGINVFFRENDLKWSNDFSLVAWSENHGQPEDVAANLTVFRSQLQLVF